MKRQELRFLNDDIGARLARYGENQHSRDDDYEDTQTGSDKIFTKNKEIKSKFSDDGFGHKDVSNTKNVQVVQESDTSGISDYMKMDKRNQRVFHDIPSSSHSEPRIQYRSNLESKTSLPDTGLEFSRFGVRPKVRKQDHHYSNLSFRKLNDDNFGTNPVYSPLRNKDGHLDHVKIEKTSKNYKKPFVSSEHNSYNYSKDCGYEYEGENSSCSDSNFHSTIEHENIQYNPRNVSNSNQYSEHSDNQIEQDVIHTVFIKGKGVVASKNQKRLETEFSERRARNRNFDVEYESDDEYYNSYLDMKGNSKQIYSKSKNIHNNSYVSKFPRSAANFIPDNSIQSSSKEYTRAGINDFPEISAGISLNNSSSNSYSKQINNLNTDSHQFYDTSLYVNPDNIGSYANYCNENYAQFEGNKNVKSRKRHAWVDEITPYETNNFENEFISNQYKANTFSMHDACKVATLFRSPTHGVCERNFVIPVADGKNYYQTKRKCWAKTCWSPSWHSHASLSSKVELLSKQRFRSIQILFI